MRKTGKRKRGRGPLPQVAASYYILLSESLSQATSRERKQSLRILGGRLSLMKSGIAFIQYKQTKMTYHAWTERNSYNNTVVKRCGSTVLNAFQSRHLEVNKNYIRPRAKRAQSLA